MAAKTYLEIVNEAITESRASLDQLTSANFASPPRTVLYNQFKRWANVAYRELMMKRPEWEYRSERAALEIWPRLHLSGLTYTPSVGDVLVGTSSGVIFTVQAVHTYEDVEGDADTEVTVSVEFSEDSDPSNIIIKEVIDQTEPVATSSVGYIKAIGRYNFLDEVDGMFELDIKDVHLSYPAADADTYGNELHKLTPLSRDKWQPSYSEYPWTSGYSHPHFITEMPDGNYDLFPKPLRNYILSFGFRRTWTEMSAYDDTPEALPEQYHDYLVWRVVQEYADFNQDSGLFMRAKKHVDEYLYWLERDRLPKPSLVGNLFRAG